MKITIKSFLTLRHEMKNQAEFEMDVDGITIGDLLDLLCRRFGEGLKQQIFDPKTNEINQLLRVLVNGRHYTTLPDKLETQLQDNDEIALFPPVVGG